MNSSGSQFTFWEWFGLLWIGSTILYLIHFAIRWRSYLGEPMELQYQGGYAGIEGPLDGELVLTGQELRFTQLWKPDSVHFQVPLAQILRVSTDASGISVLSYWAIGAPIILGQRNFLVLRIQDAQGAQHTVRFAAHRHSKAPMIWRRWLRSIIATSKVEPR